VSKIISLISVAKTVVANLVSVLVIILFSQAELSCEPGGTGREAAEDRVSKGDNRINDPLIFSCVGLLSL
jgi:hypothetical protein